MNEIHKFLIDVHSKTRWPFFRVDLLRLAFGPTTVVQLNQLRESGHVKKRRGINSDLVELLKPEQ